MNRAALRDPKALKAFARASEALEKAQRRALEGGDKDVRRWREAAAREREASQAVIDAAASAAEDAGHPATKQALGQVDATLRAAAADPALRKTVVAGRLEREQSAATIGTLGLTAEPRSGDGRRGTKKSAAKRESAQARREVKRLERELADAEARIERRQDQVEQTTAVLRREKEELAAAKREATALRRELKSAQRRAGK